jgi:leader peptidase (prepilin peptidase)/N-methyltransferase
VAVVVGAVLGSFLNVCIYRLPRGLSIVYPPSHCPHCHSPIKWWQNIPIISFILLKGRCSWCQTPISFRYPLVEILSAGVTVLVVAQDGAILHMIWAEAFLLSLIVATFVDIDFQIIPDSISLGGLVWGITASFAGASLVTPAQMGLGILVCGGIFLAIALIVPHGMGGGDVKLAAMFGANLGLAKGLLAMFLGICYGSVIGVLLLAFKIKGRKDRIPFGPFLVLGAYTAYLWGEEVIRWYLRLTGF